MPSCIHWYLMVHPMYGMPCGIFNTSNVHTYIWTRKLYVMAQRVWPLMAQLGVHELQVPRCWCA